MKKIIDFSAKCIFVRSRKLYSVEEKYQEEKA
jgi:hypothetical protein